MLISELIEMLKQAKKKHGDIESTMIGTVLPEGFSASTGGGFSDVFESTVSSFSIREDVMLGKRILIQWQI